VSDGVYAYIQPDGTWWINNTGFVVAHDGVIAIDSCATEQRTRLFLDAVGVVTKQPIRVLINTHHHGDHTHGNYLTHPAAIVGHEKCRDLVIASGISHFPGVWESRDWGELRLAPPMITFQDRVDIWAGDLKLEVHYIGGPGHTTNDSVIWIPERRVLFSGDLVFNGGMPFVVMGSISGSRKAIARLRTFDARVIVPGHGPVCEPSVLDGIDRYFAFVQELAAHAVEAGMNALDAAREADISEFAHLSDGERLVGNLHRAIFEHNGGEPGAELNLVGIISDMITFNGGKPLRCRV
jgi:cyclase